MTGYTRDDALAFIDSLRALAGSRTGFKWLGEKFSALAAYVETTAEDNERLNAFIKESGNRERFKAYCEERIDRSAHDSSSEVKGR